MTKYYIAKVAGANNVTGAHEHRWVGLGDTAGSALMWVRWGDEEHRRKFEAGDGVIPLGTAAHPRIPAAALTALGEHGVLHTHTVVEAVELVAAKLGGIDLIF